MPSLTAKRKCPELLFVPPRFAIYRAVSRQINGILSLHFAHLAALSGRGRFGCNHPIAGSRIRDGHREGAEGRVRAETGLTAPAGVSHNSFPGQAGLRPPQAGRLVVIMPTMGPGFVEDLPVGRFHGVGPVTAAKMNELGIYTGPDLRTTGPANPDQAPKSARAHQPAPARSSHRPSGALASGRPGTCRPGKRPWS